MTPPIAAPPRRRPQSPPRPRPAAPRVPRSAAPPPRRPRPSPSKGSGGGRSSTALTVSRLRFFKVVLLLVLVLMVLRLVDLQVARHHQYQHAANLQLRQTISLPAVRGGIFDRNGAVLAMSVPTKEVIADNFQIAHPVEEAAALAPLLGVPAATLTSELQRHSGYVVLDQHLSTARAATIAKDNFPGITMVDTSSRTVPNGPLAQSVVGLTNASGTGSAGLEYQYQHLLAGQSGSTTLLETPYGVSLPQGGQLHSTPSVAGTGIELSLDQPLQYVTEQALGAEIASTHALSGTAIVMDTRTGQVLSMANLVSTQPQSGPISTPLASQTPTGIAGVAQAQNNLAVTQTFEPGSVFKIVAFSAALDAGLINPQTTFSVPDRVTVDTKVFHDAELHATQSMTATQILAQSSNVGTYLIARQLGESGLLAQIERLGFGQSTGLNFPGESQGLLMSAASWEPTDMAAMPIGQVDATTPLQMLDAYNAIANGGVFVNPSLVRATVGSDGRLVPAKSLGSRRVMSAQTAAEMQNMLEQVVTVGTGVEAAIPGYLVAGKTGTAAIPTPGQASYVKGAYNATFVGFAPANHPVFSAIVVLQRPVGNYYGGSTSAPVFAKIMSYALHRFGIPTSPGGNGAQVPGAVASLVPEST